MSVLHFIRAIISRVLFLTVSLAAVWMLKIEENEPKYWFLTFLLLPLVAEMIITLKRRHGKDYKWFSPPIFLFLISIIPSIWLLELEYQAKKDDPEKCANLASLVNQQIPNLNDSPENHTENVVKDLETYLSKFCSKNLILAFQQILLFMLIVGKWLLPRGGGISRQELSQLLLIFVGTAADSLEFATATLDDVRGDSPKLVYTILAVWTWSMLQFPLHLAVVNTKGDNKPSDEDIQEVSLLAKYSTDLWSIVETFFIQDGPFLVVRLTVIIYYRVLHQTLIFFSVKNFLVIILSFYRLCTICIDYRQSRRSAISSSEDPEE